jgi:hypothetical protein
VLEALAGIRAQLEVHGCSLASLLKRHREEGEWPVALLKRMAALEREVRGERQDIGRPPKVTRRRPLGAD